MTVDKFWQRVRDAVFQFKKRRQSPRPSRDGRRAMLFAEQLEPRELLSVNQIFFDATNNKITVQGTSDADQVSVIADSPSVIRVRAVSIDGVVEATFQRSVVSSLYFYGGNGNDRFENQTDLASLVLGEAGDDTLIGGSSGDELQGGLGNDVLMGGAGDDRLLGGDGNDRLFGNGGDNHLAGDAGDDELQGGDGNDVLLGYAGADRLLGGGGNDQLVGNEGDDLLAGDAGDDQLQGGAGNDLLFGYAGNDLLLGGDGNDQLFGNEGNDHLAGEAGNDNLQGGADNDVLLGYAGNDRLLGGDGNDQLFGNEGDDHLAGDAGDDQLQGGAGNDLLFGYAGNDLLLGGDGNDQMFGNEGNDNLAGDAGNDILQGGADNDILFGYLGDDRLLGGDGNDQLFGNDGDDLLAGDAGDDQLQGGAGNDLLFGYAGNDLLLGGDGDDQMFGNEGNDNLAGEAGNDNLQGGADNDVLLGYAGNDRLLGGDGNDQLFGNEGDDHLAGEAGDDELQGGADNDVLLGYAGNDRLLGGDGNDQLFGNEGNDYLAGEAGNDNLQGGANNDILFGYLGDDRLFGGDGDDQLFGNEGNDVLAGEAGNDRLSGMLGNDTLLGGLGDDDLAGDEGTDWLYGEDGNDQLLASGGNDILLGGAGNDWLSVVDGQHLLNGGAGVDSVTGGAGNDVLIGGTGIDLIRGLGGEDLLIGGTTVYDENTPQLSSVLAAWLSTAPYASRVAQFENDLFTSRLKSNTTVFDDGVADQIFGGDGQDWFFLTGFAGIYDPNLVTLGEPANGANSDGHSHPGAVIFDHPPALEGFAFIDSLDKLNDRLQTESLHSLVPHVADSVLQREHLALTQLVRYDQVTHYAVADGAWSNPNTWHDGVVPGQNARVLIPIGVDVTVNGVISARIATVRVDGTLSFSTTANSELRVDTIVVTGTGRFEMGTEAAPIPANVSARLLITDNGPIDRVADPFGIGRGLISHGSVSIVGAAVTSYVAFQGSALAGTSILTLKSVPVGWKVGDNIVVASSTAGADENEVRRIAAISGTFVLLDRPLTYNHVPMTAAFEIHVANTTRNVSIASESTVVDRRGHVMFMHNRDVHIANAGFYRLGRTDKGIPVNDPVVDANWQLKPGTGTNPRGRYSVHFHRNGFVEDGNPATITGSAVVDSPGWGFVNHSSYVDMQGNVAYNVRGAAFATEVGDEIGSFVNNLAIGSTGSGEGVESRLALQDFGHQGDGFWLQGPGIIFTGNVAAGNTGSAFILFAQGLIEGGVRQKFLAANLPDPSIAGGEAEVSVESVPMRRFDNNVGYASSTGLAIWYHLRSALGQQGLFADSTFWNNSHGVSLPYSQQTILRNLTVVRTPSGVSGVDSGIGVSSNLVTRDITYDNLTVSGHYRGIVVPRRGFAVVVGGNYDNYVDFLVQTGVEADRLVLLNGPIRMNRLIMEPYFVPVGSSITHIFLRDRVILNFGPYQNQRVYYLLQNADAIPFPSAVSPVPAAYVGLTSQQLWDQYGIAVGGTLTPANATSVPGIVGGLVGPPS